MGIPRNSMQIIANLAEIRMPTGSQIKNMIKMPHKWALRNNLKKCMAYWKAF